MTKLGFHPRWVSLMMAYVGSVRYKIRFNSNETGVFLSNKEYLSGIPLVTVLVVTMRRGFIFFT
jgi:hypothetical protein